ncbi:MAG: hypothetical protein UHE86_01220 [Acutalibacteraceae bacterium]|nr:hypothetical protein [Acutalibacteraceae bacterium]
MPNTSNDDIIIVGSLSDKELRDSIDKLVDYVGDKTTIMAGKFDVAMEKMKSAMKDFAITQKVSVDLMQDAWKQMSASFDAMLKAQQNATNSGNNSGAGGGNSQYADNTVGHLQEIIALEEKRRKEMTLGSVELDRQNILLEKRRKLLKEETSSPYQKIEKCFSKEFGAANSMSAKTLQQAEDKLKKLIDLQDKFKDSGLIDETKMNRLQKAIDGVTDKITKLRNAKPKSLNDVLGMDESSVDAIAKKMAALKKVTVDPQNTAQVKQLGDEYQRLKRLQAELMGQNIQMTHSNNYLAQSFGYIRNRLVYALTLGAISNFTKELYQIRGQYELIERSLGVLLDDMGKGSQIFRELNAMSLKSPFTLIDLAGAAKQLTAYNFAEDEVVDTTRRLADISAALGVPMERLVYNLGQIRAQNVLNARDARDFANTGLPIVSMLADMYTEQKRFGDEMVTTANVYDMMSKKMVSYADVLQVINKVTDEGGKFFDFQAKQADTLQVQMANLNLAYNNMLNSIGKENQGVLAGGLSIVKDLLLNWRQVYRVLMTLITTYGAYRTAVALVGWEHKRTFGARMLISIQQWVDGIKNAKTAMQTLNAAMSSNVLGLFVSALAAAVSYFWLFNNSADEMKEKLKEIQETFTSMRSNATDIFVSGLKSDNVNTQIDKLKELVSFAESELGITIPVNIQDVDAENVAQKLRDAKNYIDEYLDFAQAFSETAAGNKYLNEYFTEFGNTAQSTFTNIYSSVNTVIEGLQKLADEGRASARDLEILEELVTGKKEDESKLEYLQRLVSLYEELGLIGKKVVTPVISYTHSTEDNMEFLEEQQKKTLDRIKVHNKQVFATMLQDVQDFYSNANIAEYQLERTVKELAERIDINSIPEDQRTLKLSAAINEEASKNNWNDFAKQYARQVANTKFGTTIEISDESKKNTEVELKEWQKKLQSWADANGIALGITLNFNTTEVDAANEALQNVKKAQELLAVQQRKLKVGTATQADVDAAEKALKNARLVATQAGADLASLNRKGGSGGSKKDDVLDVLKDEISLVKKLQSEYDKLTKSGVKSADAIVAMQDAYGSTLRLLNKDLQKFGLPRIELSNILGKNPHEILAVFTELRNILESKGLSNLERMKAVEGVIKELKVSAKTYDMKKVTDGLNSELGKIKDEYELAIELDANPELGGMFADMFNIDVDALPQTFGEALERAQKIVDAKLKELKITQPFDLMRTQIQTITDELGNEKAGFAKLAGQDENSDFIKALIKAQDEYRKSFKKNLIDTEKYLDDYVKKYGDYSDKVAEIERNRLKQIRDLNNAYYTEQMRNSPEYKAKENAINLGAQRQKDEAQFEAFKNTQLYVRMFENLDYVSTQTLQTMKERLEDLKNSMKNLSPEQLKQIQSQYQKITKELSTRNPFKGLIKNLKDYRKAVGKEGKQAQKDFADKQKEYDAQAKLVAELKEEYEQKKDNKDVGKDIKDNLLEQIAAEDEKLAKLKQELDAADKLNQKYDLMRQTLGDQADAIAKLMQVIAQNLQSLAELRDQLGDQFGLDLGDSLNGVIDGLAQAGQGISKAVSSAQSGDVFGIVGGVVGVFSGIADGIASIFGDGSARTKRINKEIAKSVETVRQLNMAYKELDAVVNNAMGAQELQARREQIQNKQRQVEELQRQMELEQSKRSKDRDDDKIKEYQESIQDLELEIAELKKDVVANLLGSDIKDAAEQFVSTWVDAWRQGGDTMEALNEKFDDMIDNMIAKSVASYLVSKRLQKIFDEVDKMSDEKSEGGSEITMNELKRLKNLIGDKSIAEQINDDLANLYGALGIAFGVNSEQEKNLSALQQGIAGVSEETASAVEAYLNGMSQQAYLRNDLLVQIRDTIMSFDMDVQLGVFSQMLLQLQNNYIVMQSMQSMMEGWTTPSGQGIRVELIS